MQLNQRMIQQSGEGVVDLVLDAGASEGALHVVAGAVASALVFDAGASEGALHVVAGASEGALHVVAGNSNNGP